MGDDLSGHPAESAYSPGPMESYLRSGYHNPTAVQVPAVSGMPNPRGPSPETSRWRGDRATLTAAGGPGSLGRASRSSDSVGAYLSLASLSGSLTEAEARGRRPPRPDATLSMSSGSSRSHPTARSSPHPRACKTRHFGRISAGSRGSSVARPLRGEPRTSPGIAPTSSEPKAGREDVSAWSFPHDPVENESPGAALKTRKDH